MTGHSRETFRAAIKLAREVHESRGVPVIDAMLADGRFEVEDLTTQFFDNAGVIVLLDSNAIRFDGEANALLREHAVSATAVNSADGVSRYLVMSDPWNTRVLSKASLILNQRFIAATAPSAVLALLRPAANESSTISASRKETRVPTADNLVVEFVDSAIRAAYQRGASDVHFECSRSGVVTRLRCDGVLLRLADIDDVRRAEEVISRIKVLAQLDITERRLPQDGRFRTRVADVDIDLRVSIIPSVFGEDAVLRLLDKAQLRNPEEKISLDRLGFDPDSVLRIRDLAELPHGMLLVTGPTGSGKTTTVYAALSEVNDGLEKIITIEDPVEYELVGVLQVPVNERKGLTFAKGLRSVLRHDPDRLLVGEIRDAETAEIAVQSALTGHQVFTTIHANSIFDVAGRFRHFDLDMFGFMAALNGVVVQRLVRLLCQNCVDWRAPVLNEGRWFSRMGHADISAVPFSTGCAVCGGTGYKGRRVIAEVHAIDDGFRDLVTTHAPVSALRAHIENQHIRTLGQHGAALVVQGLTSSEEIKRVVGWQ